MASGRGDALACPGFVSCLLGLIDVNWLGTLCRLYFGRRLRHGRLRVSIGQLNANRGLGHMFSPQAGGIVREEQNRAGAVEILMPTIQSADLWRESGRYDDYGKEMLRITDRHDRDMLFGPTNEEMVTEIFRAYVRSYKDLPLNLYHIQWKFRDEVRPRFG